MLKEARSTMYTEVSAIYKHFRGLGYDNISEFTREVRSDLSPEAWGSYFNGRKGEFRRPDLRSLLIMMHELSLSPNEIEKILVIRGEHKIASLIAKEDISPEEKTLISQYRKITDKGNRELIKKMLHSLRG